MSTDNDGEEVRKILMDSPDKLYEQVRQQIAEDSVFVLSDKDRWTPRDAGKLRYGQQSIPYKRMLEENEPEVYYSRHLEQGTAYRVSKELLSGHGKLKPFNAELMTGFQDRLERELNSIFLHGARYAHRPAPVVILWQRKANESLIAWGKRLAEYGYLDVPDIRYVYQDAVWSAPVQWVKKMLRL
jgi:hypothetical protein